jgi:hypothetical protein
MNYNDLNINENTIANDLNISDNENEIEDDIYLELDNLSYKSISSINSNSSDCIICLYNFNDDRQYIRPFNCIHRFHNTCIIEWIKKKMENTLCPLCKSKLNTNYDIYNNQLVIQDNNLENDSNLDNENNNQNNDDNIIIFDMSFKYKIISLYRKHRKQIKLILYIVSFINLLYSILLLTDIILYRHDNKSFLNNHYETIIDNCTCLIDNIKINCSNKIIDMYNVNSINRNKFCENNNNKLVKCNALFSKSYRTYYNIDRYNNHSDTYCNISSGIFYIIGSLFLIFINLIYL